MTAQPPHRESLAGIFWIFLRLGCTSFGGPIAHLGYYRQAFVNKRAWLTEASFADLLALCQTLPGPASSQLGMALGLIRGGYGGALAAWLGFTLPSALVMVLFALGLARSTAIPSEIVHGLKVVAVAVVAQAVWSMARTLCTDTLRITIMALAACCLLLLPGAASQVGVIIAAGLAGVLLCRGETRQDHDHLSITVGRRVGLGWLALFVVLLLGLPLLAQALPGQTTAMMAAFFRAGSLVFGGGHVVLPLLQAEVVGPGWVDNETFLAGYGAAQAVPGPLFTFAAFLGAAMHSAPSGVLGGVVGLLAIFAPSFLLIAGALPFWEQLRQSRHTLAALAGINAAVVGLLLAALYQPVWTSAITDPQDFALAVLAFVALMFWRWPPWLVVLGCALGSWALALLG